MGSPASLLHGYLALLVVERMVELILSSRNARRALATGSVESGRGHYPAMVLFHTGFLVSAAVEPILLPRSWPLGLSLAALCVALAAQGLRWWAVATLGSRWTTRIVVHPGAPPATAGPYRYLRHPNYVAVALELAAVPLIGGAIVTALVATVGNALLLAVRIPAEERALGADWERSFEGLRRFFPGGRP